jgi:hypothetical protein
MEPDQMRSFCVDWASTVDSIEHTHDVQKASLTVLFGMMNSPHWRPHIVSDKWKLLKYFTSVPDDSQPLRRCLNNPELMYAVPEAGNPAAIIIWLKVLWSHYGKLTLEVRKQLELRTKEVVQGGVEVGLDMYILVVEEGLKKAEDSLQEYTTWSIDPAAIALRKKVEELREANASLIALNGDK